MRLFILTAMTLVGFLGAEEDHATVGSHPITQPAEEIIENGAFYGSSHPGLFQFVTWIGPNGCTIDLHDGTQWGIHPSDRHKVYQWYSTDELYLTVGWASGYKYTIVNQRNGQTVHAKLTRGPVRGGSYTRNVELVDFEHMLIHLTDGSCFQWASSDDRMMRKWYQVMVNYSENHAILIGVNTGLSSFFNEYILIDIETDSYIRANWVN